MQVSEFKAWFEGFTEDMTKLPTVKQWARIKARIEEIDGVETTERVFIDRYWRRYEPYWTWSNINIPCGSLTVSTNQPQLSNNSVQLTGTQTVLNASQAFTALGRAEATSIAA